MGIIYRGLKNMIPKVRSVMCTAARAGLLHGAVVAGGRGKSIDILSSWGYASIDPGKKPMHTDSVFDISSVTKAVATASACGVCIDRGLIEPDAPAADYLPGLGQFPGSVIRVIDLATHCSGYDNRKFDSYGPSGFFERAINTPAQGPARQTFKYSCRNFLVLGALVEQVSGMTLPDFCRDNIFSPVGMQNTAFGPLNSRLDKVVPTEKPAGIISDNQARTSSKPVGNSGLFSPAEDIAAFCRMMLNNGRTPESTILGKKAMEYLTEPCGPRGLPKKSFGWDMSSCHECAHRPSGLSRAAFGHSGWTGQSVWIDQELDLFTIVLTNRTHCLNHAKNYEQSKRFRARIAEILISNL